MKVDEALKDVQRIALDTAPLIYYVENHPTYADLVHPIIERISLGQLDAIGSALLLTELLVHPIRTGDKELAEKYAAILSESGGFRIVSVDRQVARLAADLRVTYNLRTPDALHIACALTSKCDAFLTNDKDFRRISEINVILLDELELE